MVASRMVPLVTVTDGFHARVVAARLGADGILTELRGGHGGPYPVGEVEVLVGEEDYALAAELLRADDAESAADDVEPADEDVF